MEFRIYIALIHRFSVLVWTAKRFPKTLTSQLLKHDPQQGWKFNTRLTVALKQAS